jgi:hypothetical protein
MQYVNVLHNNTVRGEENEAKRRKDKRQIKTIWTDAWIG